MFNVLNRHFFPFNFKWCTIKNCLFINLSRGCRWPWSYGSWIYNYLCNQCLSPLTLWVRIQLRRGVLDTTLCDKLCQWLAVGRWFSRGTPVSSANLKTELHNIAEILLKVALNTIMLNPKPMNLATGMFDTKGDNSVWYKGR